MEILTDPIYSRAETVQKSQQNGMLNGNAIIPEENNFNKRKIKG